MYKGRNFYCKKPLNLSNCLNFDTVLPLGSALTRSCAGWVVFSCLLLVPVCLLSSLIVASTSTISRKFSSHPSCRIHLVIHTTSCRLFLLFSSYCIRLASYHNLYNNNPPIRLILTQLIGIFPSKFPLFLGHRSHYPYIPAPREVWLCSAGFKPAISYLKWYVHPIYLDSTLETSPDNIPTHNPITTVYKVLAALAQTKPCSAQCSV